MRFRVLGISSQSSRLLTPTLRGPKLASLGCGIFCRNCGGQDRYVSATLWLFWENVLGIQLWNAGRWSTQCPKAPTEALHSPAQCAVYLGVFRESRSFLKDLLNTDSSVREDGKGPKFEKHTNSGTFFAVYLPKPTCCTKSGRFSRHPEYGPTSS